MCLSSCACLEGRQMTYGFITVQKLRAWSPKQAPVAGQFTFYQEETLSMTSTLLLMCWLGKERGLQRTITSDMQMNCYTAEELLYKTQTINILSSIDKISTVKGKCWLNYLCGLLTHCSLTINCLGRHGSMISICRFSLITTIDGLDHAEKKKGRGALLHQCTFTQLTMTVKVQSLRRFSLTICFKHL